MRVAICDDEKLIRTVLKEVLSIIGYAMTLFP